MHQRRFCAQGTRHRHFDQTGQRCVVRARGFPQRWSPPGQSTTTKRAPWFGGKRWLALTAIFSNRVPMPRSPSRFNHLSMMPSKVVLATGAGAAGSPRRARWSRLKALNSSLPARRCRSDVAGSTRQAIQTQACVGDGNPVAPDARTPPRCAAEQKLAFTMTLTAVDVRLDVSPDRILGGACVGCCDGPHVQVV